MNWVGGGLVTIMIYSTMQEASTQSFTLITQNNLDILSQASQELEASIP